MYINMIDNSPDGGILTTWHDPLRDIIEGNSPWLNIEEQPRVWRDDMLKQRIANIHDNLIFDTSTNLQYMYGWYLLNTYIC